MWVACALGPLRAQSGADVGSAISATVGQSLQVVGDRVTKPHVVYSISLSANQLFSAQFSRVPPWTNQGLEVVARMTVYAPGIQSVLVYNAPVASTDVGDFGGTSVLNYQVAVSGQYYLDFQFFSSGVTVRADTTVPSSTSVQGTGGDIGSASAVTSNQSLQVLGDRLTKPHVVYSVALSANQLFTVQLTRLGPWVSQGYETVMRLHLYAPGIQSVQVYNQDVSNASVGDYATTALLNYQVAVGGTYYLDFEFFNPGISVRAAMSIPLVQTVQPSGTDVGSATAIAGGQSFKVIADSVTRPHAVYSIALTANQLLSVQFTRLGPWVAQGYDTVARLYLYPPGTPSIRVYNAPLATAEVGDYSATSILNYRAAAAGQYYLDFQAFDPGILMRADVNGGSSGPVLSAIQHAASSVATALAPGLNIVLYGSNLGPDILQTYNVGSSGRLDTNVAETRVLFDGVAAPIIYTSEPQVSVMVPYAVAGKNTTQVQVEYKGVASPASQFGVTATVPGIYTASQTGSGQGAILNQNFSVNSTSNPEAAGNYIAIYGTGEGQTTPAGVDGAFNPNQLPLPRPNQPVTVSIGGIQVPASSVTYAGGAPGLLAGIIQINAQIPASLVTGSYPVVFTVGGVPSQGNVTVAVRGH